ncbi:MAG: glycosyltransferase family 87 protein [Isosphaerales bacterium]
MDGADVPGSRTWRADPAEVRRGWHYEGLGWPRSLGVIRLWIVAVWAIIPLTIWGYVDIGPRGRIEPGRIDRHMTDFTVFTEAGAAFFDGRNPYLVANPRGWHYLYPPLFAILIAPLSVFDTESQVLIWYFVNVGLAFACLGEARRLWRLVSDRAEPRRSLWIVVCGGLAALLPYLDCMQAGQLGIAILYLLIVGFRLVLQGRSSRVRFLAGLVLALPAVVKLVPSLPVVFLLFQQWSAVAFSAGVRRPWGRATSLTAGVLTGAFLFLLAIPASLIGWQANLAYLHVWHTRVVSNDRIGPNANFNIHSVRNQSLANAVYLLMKSTARTTPSDFQAAARRDRPERLVHSWVRVVIGVILTLLVAVGLALRRRTDALDQATAYSLAVCATLLVSPLAWGHYYMAAVPAALCVPLWLSRHGMPRLAGVVAAIPPILSWSYYIAMPYTGAIGLLGLGTTAWFLGVSGLILGIEISFGPLGGKECQSQFTAVKPLTREKCARLFDTSVAANAKL